MNSICRRCLSTPRPDAIFCDQCGARLGVVHRGRAIWLVCIGALMGATLVAAVALMISLRDRAEPTPVESTPGEVGDSRPAVPGPDDVPGQPSSSPPPPATAPAERHRLDHAACFVASAGDGSTLETSGGLLLQGGRAVLPLSLIARAARVRGILDSQQSPFEVERVLHVDYSRDLAIVKITGPPVQGVALPRVASVALATTRIELRQDSRRIVPLASGAVAWLGAGLGDLLQDATGACVGIITRPGLAAELATLSYDEQASRLESTHLSAGGDWTDLGWELSVLRQQTYFNTPRGLYELSSAQLGRSELQESWYTLHKLLGLMSLDAIPGTRELHRTVATALSASFEVTRPGGGISVLREAVATDPASFDLRALLARSEARDSDLRSSLESYRVAVALDPARAPELLDALTDAHVAHFEAMRAAGTLGESVAEIDRTISVLGPEGNLLYLRGLARLQLGQIEAGEADLSHALQSDASLEPLIERARRESASSRAPAGAVVVAFQPGARTVHAQVRLADRVDATFVVDTGATLSAVTPALARRLGLDPDRAQDRARVSTAGGTIEAPVVHLPSIDLSGARVESLDAIVLSIDDPQGAEGLLGNDFLSHFRVTIDSEDGLLILEPR